MEDKSQKALLRGHIGGVSSICISDYGRMIVSLSLKDDKIVRIWV